MYFNIAISPAPRSWRGMLPGRAAFIVYQDFDCIVADWRAAKKMKIRDYCQVSRFVTATTPGSRAAIFPARLASAGDFTTPVSRILP